MTTKQNAIEIVLTELTDADADTTIRDVADAADVSFPWAQRVLNRLVAEGRAVRYSDCNGRVSFATAGLFGLVAE